MAEKKGQTIVIKKITVGGAGGHGGSWKVALADFMTALMAFFLLMWLLGQSDQTKKAISDYFSTPSLIEYNFSAYGVEITLEKLFLDLLNEPLKAMQEYFEPANPNPNLLDLGSKKVALAYAADKLQDSAMNVNVTSDSLEFDIPDYFLFEAGTAKPNAQFVDVMEKVKSMTTGLKDANVSVFSLLFTQSVPGANRTLAENVASQRLDLVQKKVQASLEFDSVDVGGSIQVQDIKTNVADKAPNGFIRFRIKQKENTADGRKPRKMEELFGKADDDMSIYDNFVKQVSERKKKKAEKSQN